MTNISPNPKTILPWNLLTWEQGGISSAHKWVVFMMLFWFMHYRFFHNSYIVRFLFHILIANIVQNCFMIRLRLTLGCRYQYDWNLRVGWKIFNPNLSTPMFLPQAQVHIYIANKYIWALDLFNKCLPYQWNG